METPHAEQLIRVSWHPGAFGRLPLHLLQRLGTCWNFFSQKKPCSPALNKKSSPQLAHFKLRSENSI
jgi:hypothetical protein